MNQNRDYDGKDNESSEDLKDLNEKPSPRTGLIIIGIIFIIILAIGSITLLTNYVFTNS
jgi:hypothetical protein|tara:strand:+ start:4532 stop:4708 length:177 start_codon:yes stop_codon:yes gene_type:complete